MSAALLLSLSFQSAVPLVGAFASGRSVILASSIARRALSSVGSYSFVRPGSPTCTTPQVAVVGPPTTASISTSGEANGTNNGDSDSNDGTTLRPLVVCGPSGAGKGTIISRYLSHPTHRGSDLFGFAVSHTTRPPRPGEEDGVHYHFTTHEEMRRAIDAGEFLEHAEVHGNLYGTSYESLRAVQDDLKKDALLDIDVQGVRSVKEAQEQQEGRDGAAGSAETASNSVIPRLRPSFVFIAPPSLEVLRERLAGRGTESAADLEKRTANALAEMEYGLGEGNFDAVVVNDDLDGAVEEFARVVGELYYT